MRKLMSEKKLNDKRFLSELETKRDRNEDI